MPGSYSRWLVLKSEKSSLSRSNFCWFNILPDRPISGEPINEIGRFFGINTFPQRTGRGFQLGPPPVDQGNQHLQISLILHQLSLGSDSLAQFGQIVVTTQIIRQIV